jgi:hypothetical protein
MVEKERVDLVQDGLDLLLQAELVLEQRRTRSLGLIVIVGIQTNATFLLVVRVVGRVEAVAAHGVDEGCDAAGEAAGLVVGRDAGFVGLLAG